MATFFSGQWIGTWAGYPMTGTLTGNVSRSGNTVTLSSLTCTWTATYGYGSDSSSFFRICDGWDGWTELVRATGLTMNNGSGSKSIGNCSVTVGTTDTSHSFTFRSSDGAGIGFTVTFPSGGYAPTAPTISAASSAATTTSITWGTTNLGSPTGTCYLYWGTSNNPTTQLASKTSTGNSTTSHTGRTANTRYYYKATASNSIGSNSSSVVSAVTLPAGISSTSVSSVSETSAVIAVTCASSGSALTTTLQVSSNGSTWTDVATSVQGKTTNATISGLSPNTSYTRYFRVHTTAGNSATATVTFKTLKVAHLYGSVSGKTKRVRKLYGSVNGKTKKVKKLYASVNGKTKLIYRE